MTLSDLGGPTWASVQIRALWWTCPIDPKSSAWLGQFTNGAPGEGATGAVSDTTWHTLRIYQDGSQIKMSIDGAVNTGISGHTITQNGSAFRKLTLYHRYGYTRIRNVKIE